MKKFNKFYHANVVATIIVVVLLSGSTVAINHFEPKTIEQNLKSLDEFRNILHVYDEVPTLDDNDIPPFLLFIDRTVYRLNNILHRLLVNIYAIANKEKGEIQKAIDAASPGDTVEIPSGIYYENIFIYKPITLLGEDPETTIIDGGGGSKDGGISAENVVKITSNNVTISGFTMRNGEADGVVVVSSNVAVTNNIIMQNNGTGIRSSKSLEFILNETDNIIQGNTITNNTYGGIAVRFNNDLQISNNDIQNNGDIGIQVLDSSNVTVSDNSVHYNHTQGFIFGFQEIVRCWITVLPIPLMSMDGERVLNYQPQWIARWSAIRLLIMKQAGLFCMEILFVVPLKKTLLHIIVSTQKMLHGVSLHLMDMIMSF